MSYQKVQREKATNSCDSSSGARLGSRPRRGTLRTCNAAPLHSQRPIKGQCSCLHSTGQRTATSHSPAAGGVALPACSEDQPHARRLPVALRPPSPRQGCSDQMGKLFRLMDTQYGDDAGGEVYFKRALEIDPSHTDTLCNYALLLTNVKKDHVTAADLFRKVPSSISSAAVLLTCAQGAGLEPLARAQLVRIRHAPPEREQRLCCCAIYVRALRAHAGGEERQCATVR
eukprot:758319-Hanusia_phi.AAC.3